MIRLDEALPEDGLNQPRVTVLMAVLNGEDYVGEAIASILGQSFADFEFMIVDDGSTDHTGEVVLSFGDRRIRLLTNPENLGLSRSLNRGLLEARGEYVARQDADDVSESERLRRQVEFLDANPDVALAGTWYTEIGPDGRPRRRRALPSEYLGIRWALLFFCPFVHTSVMWRRELMAKHVGPYDETLRYSMDFELWSRVARVFPVRNLEEHLVRLRLHPDSMSEKFGDSVSEGHRLRLENIARMLRWPERGLSAVDCERRFRSLDGLARGVRHGCTPESALDAVEDLFLLHELFLEESELERSERHERRNALRREVAKRLARLARSATSEQRGLRTRIQLLAAAAGVWPRTRVHTGRRKEPEPLPASHQRPAGHA